MNAPLVGWQGASVKHDAKMHPTLRGHLNVPHEQYHGGPGISKSKLDEFAVSPRHFWLRYEQEQPAPEEKSEALVIGAASHCAVLEPDLFAARYIAEPENAPKRPTKAQLDAKKPSDTALYSIEYWRELADAHIDKIILTASQYQECLQLRDCVWNEPSAASLLKYGVAEQSFYAEDPLTGLLLKCRPDFLTDGGMFLDLKFVRDASPGGFGRACANDRYDVQSAFYPEVAQMADAPVDPDVFAFIAVEKNPYGPVCAIYVADVEMRTSGSNKWRSEVSRLAECYHSGNWPAYTPEPMPIRFPNYAKVL